MSNTSNATQIPLHQPKSQSALYKRIQLLEEENAALREALKSAGSKTQYTDHNCRLENGQWVVVAEKGKGK